MARETPRQKKKNHQLGLGAYISSDIIVMVARERKGGGGGGGGGGGAG